jgi:hypothetical protein
MVRRFWVLLQLHVGQAQAAQQTCVEERQLRRQQLAKETKELTSGRCVALQR